MLRLLAAALGLLELAFPRALVEFLTRLAYESPADVEVRPWVVTAARVEGLLLVLFALRGCRAADAE